MEEDDDEEGEEDDDDAEEEYGNREGCGRRWRRTMMRRSMEGG